MKQHHLSRRFSVIYAGFILLLSCPLIHAQVFGDVDQAISWFIMVGDIDGSSADVTIYETDGSVFLQDNPVTENKWGQGRFIVEDKGKPRFEFESAEGTGSVPLTRLSEGSENYAQACLKGISTHRVLISGCEKTTIDVSTVKLLT